MYALKPEDSRALNEADSRGNRDAPWSMRNIETGQGEAGEVSFVQDGASERVSGPAAGCLFCRYRSPGLGKDGINA